MDDKERLITPNELASMGILSLVGQWQLRKSGALQHYRVGRKILYSQRHIDAFLANCERGGEPSPQTEIAAEAKI